MSNAENGSIHLLRYGVNRCYYEELPTDPEKEYHLGPTFERKISTLDENASIYRIQLSVSLNPDNQNDKKPFNLDVSVYGVFELKDISEQQKKEVMETNATAIIFPLLRTQLAVFMTMVEIKPLVIPVMNMPALFNEKNESVN